MTRTNNTADQWHLITTARPRHMTAADTQAVSPRVAVPQLEGGGSDLRNPQRLTAAPTVKKNSCWPRGERHSRQGRLTVEKTHRDGDVDAETPGSPVCWSVWPADLGRYRLAA